MSGQEQKYVGLFIDWDNLAISTAVDFAGAVPDVRAIVKAAQRYGTILVARAYSEWNVSSERLSVYRAGVEPVYAPTFRFETDPSGGSRGKSLADPCLVTDCIDTLHLMPEMNVFVLVSGDKDLIPIVRLAQLRGKRVAVIGPDFAAAILREMADEYIPYRQLAESSDNPPTDISVHGTRAHRRSGTTTRPVATPSGTSVPARSQSPARATPLATTPGPAPVEPNGSDHSSEAMHLERVAEPLPAEETLDTGPLFTTIATILREREKAGKPRLRATNLKDQLLARISGFNERKYGFARFKDLLTAAEKAGVLTVSRTGPVQWVTGTAEAPAVASSTAEPTQAPNAEPIVSVPEAIEEPATSTEVVDLEVVQFILGLRDRSRWLTYTYVLTNLLNHLGGESADAASDAEARVTLNRLVQAGVLVVDREPREIDVNGTRHRVRLCHVVDEHALVQRALSEMAARAETEPLVAESKTETPASAAPAETETFGDGSAAEAPSHLVEVVDLGSQVALPRETEPLPTEAVSSGTTDGPGAMPPAEATTEQTIEAPTVTTLPEVTATESVAEESLNGDGATGDSTPSDGAADEGESESPSVPQLSLEESYAVLRDVVREATDANRPTTGPAAIKNRLVRKLGAFDERAFGFSKFKDYLISAERAGAIRLEIGGSTTRVALPVEPVAES